MLIVKRKLLMFMFIFIFLSFYLNAGEKKFLIENHNKKSLISESWQMTFGLLQETENISGPVDKDGYYEPSIYFDLSKGNWSFGITNYNQNNNVEYKDWTRGSYLNRLELRGHYSFINNENYDLGLLVAVRNYQWFHKGGANPTVTNNRWLNFEPNWRYNFTSKLSYEGSLGLYSMFNNGQENGYSDKELETESGLNYIINDFISVKLTYYLDRGWNLGGPIATSFNNQQIRGYIPMNFNLFEEKKTTVTPYFRQGFINKTWDSTLDKSNNEIDTRFGISFDQELSAGFAMSLEFAYEMRNGKNTAPGQKSFNKFYYTAVGLSYSFSK